MDGWIYEGLVNGITHDGVSKRHRIFWRCLFFNFSKTLILYIRLQNRT
jgi:hypothetical protein